MILFFHNNLCQIKIYNQLHFLEIQIINNKKYFLINQINAYHFLKNKLKEILKKLNKKYMIINMFILKYYKKINILILLMFNKIKNYMRH